MIPERIRLGEEYYLLASALAPRRPQVLLNHADSFAIFDLAGDIPVAGLEPYGLFHRGSRFLSRFELHLNGGFSLLLGTAPTYEGSELVTYLSNADERRDGDIVLERDTIALRRCKTLLDMTLYESLQLRTLAALQGREQKTECEEEPGKILHEMRHGEMATTGEIPCRYYGSIDATPFFLLLLAAYAGRTGDVAFIEELWPAAVAAMNWIETIADLDGDGYVEYQRQTLRGLVNQGWKDSHDAISHADGSLAEPPIALAEVQAYVYAALRGLARLARRLERSVETATWDARAL